MSVCVVHASCCITTKSGTINCRIARWMQTVKPVQFKFTAKTVIRNVLIIQVCWEAVPHTAHLGHVCGVWNKCVVCAWNGTWPVCERVEPTSRTFRDQMNVVIRQPSTLMGKSQIESFPQIANHLGKLFISSCQKISNPSRTSNLKSSNYKSHIKSQIFLT